MATIQKRWMSISAVRAEQRSGEEENEYDHLGIKTLEE